MLGNHYNTYYTSRKLRVMDMGVCVRRGVVSMVVGTLGVYVSAN